MEFNNFREQFEFRFATGDADFHNAFIGCSFIGYGTPDGDSQIDVFGIEDQSRDKIPPTGTSPEYRAFAVRIPHERFTTAP